MAYQSVTTGTYYVHPSANDVASTAGDGSYVKETILTDLLDSIAGGDWIVSGFDYASDSGLTVTCNGGTAVIGGYLISRSGTFSFTVTNGVRNHVYLTFAIDSNQNVASWGVEVASSATPPTGVPGYVKILEVEVAGGAVVSADDVRTTTHPLMGLALTGGTLTGELNMSDQFVTRPKMKDYSLEVYPHGTITTATTIDLENGNVHTATIGGNLTLTFSNAIASGDASTFLLELTNGGAYTLTFPASVDWAGGTAPTLTAAGVDILAFYTRDGGTTWHGVVSSTDSK